jgi:uncharacterized membrane protein YfcA
MSHPAPDPLPGSNAATRADARSRFLRTVAQGALSTVLVAAAATVIHVVTPAEVVDWPALGIAVATAAGTALAAYVQRTLEGPRR